MIYLLLMTLAGSILFLGYLLCEKICKSFVSENAKYKALTLVVLIHVIPLKWLKFWYRALMNLFLPRKTASGKELLMSMAAIETAEESYRTPNYNLALLIVGIWFIVAVAMLLKKCLKYFSLKRDLNRVAIADIPNIVTETVEQYRKEFHIRRKVKVLLVVSDKGIFTVGVIRPAIVLKEHFTEQELQLGMRHELAHIARGDLLIKLLFEFICCVYWFNPLITIYFRRRFSAVCESSCDERAVSGLTQEERSEYSRMVVQNMRQGTEVVLISALTGNRKGVDERVRVIMNKGKMKRLEKVIAVSLFVVLLLADSTMAFAYPSVYHVEEMDVDIAEKEAEGAGFWTGGIVADGYGVQVFEVVYDVEFIDEAGNISPVSEIQPNVFCIGHQWVSGYLQLHYKHDDGSCHVDIYNSDRCILCDTVTRGDLYATINYVKCPH